MTSRFLPCVYGLLILMSAFAAAPAVTLAEERFYMAVFGVEDFWNQFDTAHTFAVFVRADWNGSPASSTVLEHRMISWLPASGVVCIFCKEEKGRNHPLDESLEVPAQDGRRIGMWGPVEIPRELYRRAVLQSDRLEANLIQYKANDEPTRKPGIAINCEHAVADIDTDDGFLHTGIAHGFRGSRMVYEHLKPWILKPGQRQSWVATKLGLDQYPIRLQASALSEDEPGF